jgi:hypothetical protein
MKYTGTRAEQYELYKDARKDKLITREAYSEVLKDLNRREKVARAAAARAAARRAAAEEALAAAFEAAQAAAAKAARFAARQKKLAAALKKVAKTPPEFAVGLQVIFTVRRKQEDGTLSTPFPLKYSFSFNALQTEIQTVAEKIVRDERRRLKNESDLVIVSTRPKILSATRNPGTAKPKSQVKMKQAGALFLDGEEAHDFDSGSGRCVFD